MVSFQIHDEGGFPAAQMFLDGWLPRAETAFAALLGRADRSDPVHVVLSPTRLHADRFPGRPSELLALMDEDLIAEVAGGAGERLAQRFPAETYAHGVATLATESLHLPEGVTSNTPVICLDVETIDRLAMELEVPFEALLGRTAAHELSHVLRGHADSSCAATHSYLHEGDAQRDAWQILADLLPDPRFGATARAGRAAQVRLAARQPSAYRTFGHASPDRHSWAAAPLGPPAYWVTRPSRPLLPLTQEAVIELPLRTAWETPVEGDHMYLLGEDIMVGPWVVIGRAIAPRRPHPRDTRAICKYEKDRGHQGVDTWIHLRPMARLRAARQVPKGLNVSDPLLVRQLSTAERKALDESVLLTAGEVLDEVADRLREGDAQLRAELYARASPEMASAIAALAEHDPFQDPEG